MPKRKFDNYLDTTYNPVYYDDKLYDMSLILRRVMPNWYELLKRDWQRTHARNNHN